MKIGIIDNMQDFEGVRDPWNRIHACDPSGDVFTSWAWFRGWLGGTPYRWKILGVKKKDTGDYLAFLPLGYQERVRRGVRIVEASLGGNPSSDHAGFVCLPEFREEAVLTLGAFLKRQKDWNLLRLQDVFDPKVDFLVQYFSGARYEVEKGLGHACPFIPLPETWDEYLEMIPHRRDRRRLRSYLRDFEESADFEVKIAGNENFDACLESFIRLHSKRWPQVPRSSLNLKSHLLKSCFAEGLLLLATLDYRGQLVATAAAFLDRKNSTIADYNGGWEPEFKHLSPANRLKAYLIHHAITTGYRYFDFLRGNEAYKTEIYGAQIRYNNNFVIHRKDFVRYWEKGLNLAGILVENTRQMATVLRRST